MQTQITKSLTSILMIVSLFFATAVSTQATNSTTTTTTTINDLSGVYSGTLKLGNPYYYVTQTGKEVYMVGENFDASWCIAFKGILSGDQISGEWYGLPKGKLESQGKLTFKISDDGRKWEVVSETGGFPDTYMMSATLPAQIPATRKAAFSGNSLDDLTGRYMAKNAHLVHLRDQGGRVVFFSESMRTKENGDRPGMATVFFGSKKNGKISGEWVDLPLGYTSNTGQVTFGIIGPKLFRFEAGYFPGIAYDKLD